jgi:hypothetical protein
MKVLLLVLFIAAASVFEACIDPLTQQESATSRC